MSDNAFSATLDRRRLLALGGGAAAAGSLAACGSNTGRELASTTGGASGGGSGATLSQWYHQYGEAGTQQAVEKYAAAYKDATVKVSWKPGDYDQSTAASLLTDAGPDVFEYGNGPTIDMIKGKPGRRPHRPHRRREERLQPEHPRADDLRRQDVCHPAGRRHAAARLPQVDARQGRHHAAADHRRAHRRGEEADAGQRQGPLPRQRRRRRPHGRPDAVVGRARLPHQGQPVRLRRPARGDRPRQAPRDVGRQGAAPRRAQATGSTPRRSPPA